MTLPVSGFEHLRVGGAEFRCTPPISLTDAQIKALPTTSIAAIVAPGSGLAINPLFARLVINAAAGAYTNINAAAAVTLRYTGDAFLAFTMSYLANDAAIVTGSVTGVTDLFGAAANRAVQFLPYFDTEDTNGWGFVPFVRTLANTQNKALELAFDNNGGGNLTGGNPLNNGLLTVAYLVL